MTSAAVDLSIAIPAYNEEENIGRVYETTPLSKRYGVCRTASTAHGDSWSADARMLSRSRAFVHDGICSVTVRLS
jgi:hypothetical protein